MSSLSHVFMFLLCLQFSIQTLANDPHATKSADEKAHTASSSGHAHSKGKSTPDEAYQKLLSGHKRYMNMSFNRSGNTIKDRQRLATGQEPHTIFLSCSDSRVPPEIIFDQSLGEIFVVRTAGEALDSSAIASIEYAVSHLGSNLIVVMGHESCGAVKAALGTLNGGDAGSVWLNKLVSDIHPRLKKFSGLPQSDGVIVEGWANVHGVVKDLRERSKIVEEAIKSGNIQIKKALYHLGSGDVEWRE